MDLAALRHVAALAELSLSPEEEARFAADVGRIVAYVDELASVDTEDVPPTTGMIVRRAARSGDNWRPDRAVPGLSHEEALDQAPRPEHGGFAVPGFIE